MKIDLTTITAGVAFVMSVGNFLFNLQGRMQANAQEKRKLPKLHLALLTSSFRRDEDQGQTYFFKMTISNPTDNNNSVAATELVITYQAPNEATLILKLPPCDDAPDVGQLVFPAAISAHNSVAGVISFKVPGKIVTVTQIQSYRIHFIDAHGGSFFFDPVLVREDIHAS